MIIYNDAVISVYPYHRMVFQFSLPISVFAVCVDAKMHLMLLVNLSYEEEESYSEVNIGAEVSNHTPLATEIHSCFGANESSWIS